MRLRAQTILAFSAPRAFAAGQIFLNDYAIALLRAPTGRGKGADTFDRPDVSTLAVDSDQAGAAVIATEKMLNLVAKSRTTKA